MVNDFGKIKDEAIRYFTYLYGNDGRDKPRIPNLFSTRIEHFPMEVKYAIMNMGKDKSPGPDGSSMLFYQECWDIIQKDLMEVFVEFFDNGVISKGINATFLVLLSKKNVAT